MITSDINHKSWHMWLANFGVSDRWDRISTGDRVDICSYIRRVLFGVLKLAVLSAAIGFMTLWVLFSIGNIFGWLFLGYMLEGPAIFFIIMSISLLSVFVIFYTKNKVDEYQWKKRSRYVESKPKKPGFMSLAYRKFKDKTCFMLEVK